MSSSDKNKTEVEKELLAPKDVALNMPETTHSDENLSKKSYLKFHHLFRKKSAENKQKKSENQESPLRKFLRNGPYNEQTFKIDKTKAFKAAFSHDLVYDSQSSFVDKLRNFLLCPQLNLIIIVLIIIDWSLAVIEMITDLIEDKSDFILFLEQAIIYLSISILSIFLIEILCKIVLVPKLYLQSKLEIFDALIVFVSFGLELFFLINKHDFHGIASLMTIFRYIK